MGVCAGGSVAMPTVREEDEYRIWGCVGEDSGSRELRREQRGGGMEKGG